MKRLRHSQFVTWLSVATALGLVATTRGFVAHAAVPKSPEAETLWLGRHLKPIPDDEWKNIAGTHTEERYGVVKGDTLFDISKRLFGDGKYWPKVWALNNGDITNPHLIRPGKMVAFSPGTGTSLPSLGIGDADHEDASVAKIDGQPRASMRLADAGNRSTDWQHMPTQPWEYIPAAMMENVDSSGLDRRSRVVFGTPKGIELEAFASTDKIEPLGHLVGARSEATYLTIGDTVYIEADKEVQVGEIYSLVQSPLALKAAKSDRSGYMYVVHGKVKIVGVKDKLFIGTLLNSFGYLDRDAQLVPVLPRIKTNDPIPGPSPLEAVIHTYRPFSTEFTSQHKLVFMDRGSDDGVQPGMVFRAYDHYDPNNGKKVTDSDFVIAAEIQVLQVSERFCTGLVTRSLSPIKENDTAILLTDVSDLKNHKGTTEHNGDAKPDQDEINQLDDVDVSGGIGKKEERELRQLEKDNEKDKTPNPVPTPDPSPTPVANDLDIPLDAPAPTTDAVVPEAPAPETAAPPATAPDNLPPPPSPESGVAPEDAVPPTVDAVPDAPQSEPPSSKTDDAKAIDQLLDQ